MKLLDVCFLHQSPATRRAWWRHLKSLDANARRDWLSYRWPRITGEAG